MKSQRSVEPVKKPSSTPEATGINITLGILLVPSVTIVLVCLLFNSSLSVLTIVAVTTILVTLILVVGGAPDLLPSVLRVILHEMNRVLRW